MKPLRLKGKKLRDLYRAVHGRDGGCCQGCGAWVELGTVPHHIKFRSQGGEDTMENLITYCHVCHAAAHGIKCHQ